MSTDEPKREPEEPDADERPIPPLIDDTTGKPVDIEGVLWVIAPWLLVIRSRLSYSMVEMLVLTLAVAATLGVIVSMCLKGPTSYSPLVVLFFLLLHVHLMLFAWPIYYLRTKSKGGARGSRLAFIVVSQGLFALFPLFLNLIAKEGP
ncbi:MAG: hypothetical protein L6R28_24740 [Planctomycetes bacterium]|nr:hypothetical protein [Planctomycetota bacterium]